MYIDTHTHLTMPEYSSDLAEVLQRAKEGGVEAIINVSFDLECSKQSVKLANENDLIYAAVGIHPQHAEEVTAETIEELKKLVLDPKVVAIGETGFDYYYTEEKKEVQKEVFRKHLQLAQELNLPLIIHDREAHEDVISVLKEEKRGNLTGVFHCFSGDEKFAQTVMEMGFLISFVGNLTFKKADKLRKVVEAIPLEKIMLETDCPYLAPQVFRGRRNEPAYIVYIAHKISEIKKVAVEEVARITTDNARKFFNLDYSRES